MTFLIQQTMLYAVPLMIVALAGVFAERSGIINLALEGIMIFGAFIGVLFVRTMQDVDFFVQAAKTGDWLTLQGLEVMAMIVAALFGALTVNFQHIVECQADQAAQAVQDQNTDTDPAIHTQQITQQRRQQAKADQIAQGVQLDAEILLLGGAVLLGAGHRAIKHVK